MKRGLKDDAVNSILQDSDVEVDEQGQPVPGRSEIRDRLCQVDREQLPDGLNFDDKTTIHEEIEPAFTDGGVFVLKDPSHLTDEADLPQIHFPRQRVFVDTLEKAGAEMAMYFNRCTDHSRSRAFNLRVHRRSLSFRCSGSKPQRRKERQKNQRADRNQAPFLALRPSSCPLCPSWLITVASFAVHEVA